MSSILLYHNFGLGDHILMSPIVREYSKQFGRIGLFCQPQNYASVAFLFRDLSNLTIHQVPSHTAVKQFRMRNCFPWSKNHYRLFKHVKAFDIESSVRIEKQYYKNAGVAYEKKWGGFALSRDKAREDALLQKLNPAEPFAFIHDDARYLIDASRLPKLPLARPVVGVTDNIFDYCGFIEKASEVHVIDSSFMFLIDALPYKNPAQKLVVHRYARPNPEWILPVLKKPWTILN
jgi:hypothetical protein